MIKNDEGESIRQLAIKHLWMHNRDWTQMAEEGDPSIIVQGDGIKVVDSNGNSWIDVNGGYNSVNIGYGRTEIADAVYKQMKEISFFPQGTAIPSTVKFAEKLSQITPGTLSRVFPVSGGSEANETALKIARAYHHRMGNPGRYKIISRRGSYHGATGGVLWLGSTHLVPRHDYEPATTPGMIYAPQPNPYRCESGGQNSSECAIRCAQAIENLILHNNPDTVAAVIAEPVSIPEGACVPGDEYWPMLRGICDKYGVLLIDDEVICGFGRTGKMFAIEHWNVVPDIMSVAKGIVSSYIPSGATIVTEKVANQFTGEGNHLPHLLTFGGHPVSAAASLKNIEILENEGLVKNSAEVGEYFKSQLESLKDNHPSIGDVRGLGLLLAIELVSNRKTKAKFPKDLNIAARLNENFRKYRIILRVGDEIIKLGPPLCITRSEVDEIVHAIDMSLHEFENDLGIVPQN